MSEIGSEGDVITSTSRAVNDEGNSTFNRSTGCSSVSDMVKNFEPRCTGVKVWGSASFASMYATINELPYELLIQVFLNLDPSQLTSLRLVCRHWNLAIQDDETWLKLFASRFGTPRVFPSVSGLRLWTSEYFQRVQTYKKWRKGTGQVTFYSHLNNEFGYVDHVAADFAAHRLLTYSRLNGNVVTCNMSTGRDQTFVPGNHLLTSTSAHAVSWLYLVAGTPGGELYLKNLLTSTSSGTGRSSLMKLVAVGGGDAIIGVALNPHPQKNRNWPDVVAANLSGRIRTWTIAGDPVVETNVELPLEIRSDFRRLVVVVGPKVVTILNHVSLEVEAEIEHELDVDISDAASLHVDVDFGDTNVVISWYNHIFVYNWVHQRTRRAQLPARVTYSRMQTAEARSRVPYACGGDGLLYANVLSNDTVIVWNLRDSAKEITYTSITTDFGKWAPELPENYPKITCVALNSSVILIGGYNAMTNLHNVFTGELLKECSAKFPSKFNQMYSRLFPVTDILISPDQRATNGVIVCGEAVQHFQYGEISKPKKKLGAKQLLSKQVLYQQMKDQIDDYDIEEDAHKKKLELMGRYNGDEYDDEDEELRIAMALSQSVNPDQELEKAIALSRTDSEEELQKAIELSKMTTPSPTEGLSSQLDILSEEEQLRRILELSLVEH